MESEPGQTAQSPGRGSRNFSDDISPHPQNETVDMLDTHVRITSQQQSWGALSTHACPALYLHQIIVSPRQLGGWMLVLSPYTDEAAKALSHKPAKVTAQKGQSWDFIPRSLTPRACSLTSIGPAQTLSWVLVPEVRPTASWPWSRGVRAQQGTGQQSGVWLGFEKKPGPPSPQEGELSSGGRGWGAGCLFLWECPHSTGHSVGTLKGYSKPPVPPYSLNHGPGARALSAPWRLLPQASTSQQANPMPRTGPGTEPQDEGRRVGAKACKITGRSEPNHSPSRGEPAGTEAWSRMSSPPLTAERARRRTSRLQRAQGRERGLFQSGSGQGGLLACAEAVPRGAGN